MGKVTPIYAGQFYKPPYKWYRFIKRYKWKRNKTVVAFEFDHPNTNKPKKEE